MNVSLTEFLLARIAEDDAGADERTYTPTLDHPAPFGEILIVEDRIYVNHAGREIDVTDSYREWMRNLPLSAASRRTLAECQAKRAIVTELSEFLTRSYTVGADDETPTVLYGIERQLK